MNSKPPTQSQNVNYGKQGEPTHAGLCLTQIEAEYQRRLAARRTKNDVNSLQPQRLLAGTEVSIYGSTVGYAHLVQHKVNGGRPSCTTLLDYR